MENIDCKKTFKEIKDLEYQIEEITKNLRQEVLNKKAIIQKKAIDVLAKINELEEVENYSRLTFSNETFSCSEVVFEYYDSYEFTTETYEFPKEFLFDDEKLNSYLNKLKKENEDEAIRKREKEYNQFLILKEKFK